MNYNFLMRIENLMNESSNDLIKEECSQILKNKDVVNTSVARKHIIDKLKDINNISESEKKFIEREEKIDIVNDMSLGSIFETLEKNKELYENNHSIDYRIQVLKNDYSNGKAPAYIISEEVYSILEMFSFSKPIETELNKLKDIYESYTEDIFLEKASFVLESTEADRFLVENVLNLILEYKKDIISRKQLIESLGNYKYNSKVYDMISTLVTFESDKSLYITNENKYFKIDNVYSMVESIDNVDYINVNGKTFSIDSNVMNEISESELSELDLSEDFIPVNNFINSSYFMVENNIMNISLDNNNIKVFKEIDESNGEESGQVKESTDFNEDRESKLTIELNGKRIDESRVKDELVVSGYFDYMTSKKLDTVSRLIENYDDITNLNFAKNIINKKNPNKNATVFRLGENYNVMINGLENPKFNINGLQAKNLVFENLQFDISEGIYNLYYGVDSEISKVKDSISETETKINNLNREVKKIDESLNSDEIEETEELLKVKQALSEQVEKLQSEYQDLISKLKELSSVDEESNDANLDDIPKSNSEVPVNGEPLKKPCKKRDENGVCIDDEDNDDEDSEMTNEELADYYFMVNNMSEAEINEIKNETKAGALVGMTLGYFIGNTTQGSKKLTAIGGVIGSVIGRVYGNKKKEKAYNTIKSKLDPEDMSKIKKLIEKDRDVKKAFKKLEKLNKKILFKDVVKREMAMTEIYNILVAKADKNLANKIRGIEKELLKVYR